MKRIGIGIGAIVLLLVAVVVGVGVFGPGPKPFLTAKVSGKTITVSGEYTTLKQETTDDGVRVAVDSHEIDIGKSGIVVDGETRSLDGFEELDIRLRDGEVELNVER